VAYVRTVKTASGAVAVQIVWSSRRGSRHIEHLVRPMMSRKWKRLRLQPGSDLSRGRARFDLGLDSTERTGGPLEIVGSRSGHLWDALCRAYEVLGFDRVLDGDEVLRDLVLARIIEPTSKVDSLRVLTEAGVEPVSYRTVKRRPPVIGKHTVRQALSAACAGHAGLGPATLTTSSGPSGQSLDRKPNGLEHQEIRAHRTALPHRQIRAGQQTLTAADPLPDDLRDALAAIHSPGGVH
jgi:hypothetical protein